MLFTEKYQPVARAGIFFGILMNVMKVFNRNFYKFLFSFVTVIAVTLILVLIIGKFVQ